MARKKKTRKTRKPRSPNKTIRGEVLDAARGAVLGSHDVAYGGPEENFARIRRHLNVHLINRFGEGAPVLIDADVALILDLVKTGRLEGNMQHMDSWIDKAGYAACGAEVC